MANQQRIAGLVLVMIVMILSFSPLKTAVDDIASEEGATAIQTLFGTLFPYLWIFFIIAIGGFLAYDIVKNK